MGMMGVFLETEGQQQVLEGVVMAHGFVSVLSLKMARYGKRWAKMVLHSLLEVRGEGRRVQVLVVAWEVMQDLVFGLARLHRV